MLRSISVIAARRRGLLSLFVGLCLALASAWTAAAAQHASGHKAQAQHKAAKHHRRSKHHRKHKKKSAPKHGEGVSPAPPGTSEGKSGAPGEESSTAGGGSEEETTSGEGGEPEKRSGADPFAAEPLYVEPGSPASATASEWAHAGRTADAAQIEKIAQRPVAKWFGDWSYGHGGTKGDVSWWVGNATAAGRLALLVAYDLPWRDCGEFSSGGADAANSYKKFIEEMAAGIGTRKAVVILEPDALAELGCLSSEQQSSYYSLLSFAVKTLNKGSGTAVYLDAGNSGWQPPATIAARLEKAGVSAARGFSLNVSNFGTTASQESYGEAIVASLGIPSHFVIDTSRNGRGPSSGGEWCNPPGRGLGTPPTASTGNADTDALIWVKHPGTSDGTCNGGPAAGEWWPSAALELAVNSAG